MLLFFDLDGTLTNPRLGIVRCFQYALKALQRPVWSGDALEQFIGPPLPESFGKILETADQALIAEGVRLYRKRFAKEGLFENEVYPDIPETLAALQDDGFDVLVVTSKPQIFADQIVQHFELDQYFRRVYGSELSGERLTKPALIRYVLEQEKISAKDAVMIGDRSHYILGAGANGLRSIGVLWGFGSQVELHDAGADEIVASVEKLRDCILDLFGVLPES